MLSFNGGVKAGRNQPCPCGMGLKYKNCHGDETKKNIVQRIADEAMVRLIAQELLKKGLICKHGIRTGEECFDCEHPEQELEAQEKQANENSDDGPNIIQP